MQVRMCMCTHVCIHGAWGSVRARIAHSHSAPGQNVGMAASKVRNCGGLKEEEELELSAMDDSERQQIVDDSIRRIRRYTSPTR